MCVCVCVCGVVVCSVGALNLIAVALAFELAQHFECCLICYMCVFEISQR